MQSPEPLSQPPLPIYPVKKVESTEKMSKNLESPQKKLSERMETASLVMDTVCVRIYQNAAIIDLFDTQILDVDTSPREFVEMMKKVPDPYWFIAFFFLHGLPTIKYSTDLLKELRQRLLDRIQNERDVFICNVRKFFGNYAMLTKEESLAEVHGEGYAEEFDKELKRVYLLICLTIRALDMPEFFQQLCICDKNIKRVEKLCEDLCEI